MKTRTRKLSRKREQNNMELGAWGDGDDEAGEEIVTPVDLVAKLRELAMEWKKG